MTENIISRLAVMLIIIFTGFFAKKKRLIAKAGEEGLQTVLLKITFPCMMVMSMQRDFSPELNEAFLKTFGAGFVVIMVCYILFYFVFVHVMRVHPKKAGVYLMGAVFANVSFMGIPLVTAFYGQEAVVFSVANIFVSNMLFFSAGVLACHFGDGKKESLSKTVKRIFLNPPMIGIILGYVLFALSVRIPAVPAEAMESIGSVSGVLALFIVGFALAEVNLDELKDLPMVVSAGLCLVAMPFIAKIIGIRFLGEGIPLGVLVITAATPAGASIPALAAAEGSDGPLASKLIFTSTVCCIVTIPLVIKFLL